MLLCLQRRRAYHTTYIKVNFHDLICCYCFGLFYVYIIFFIAPRLLQTRSVVKLNVKWMDFLVAAAAMLFIIVVSCAWLVLCV